MGKTWEFILYEEDKETIALCFVHANGNKCWYLNGRYHRVDGPAIEYANGKTRYFINGNYIPQLDNKRIYGEENLQKFLLLII